MTDLWTDKLSDYLDDELPANDRQELERHLTECATCTEVLAELREVTLSAGRLPNDPPARDLWPGIAAAIGSPAERVVVMRPRWRREVRVALPQLLAASVALMLLSGGGVWYALHRGASSITPGVVSRPGSSGGPIAQRSTPPEPVAGDETIEVTPERASRGGVFSRGAQAQLASVSSDSPRYDATIAELQRVLSEGRGTLDSSTVRILEQNLAIIDQAVEQARRAVAADPANPYLRSHLAATMKRKADLLRKATVLASAEGQG